METTKKQFKLFKKECRKWIEFWGLKDWEITFLHEYINKNDLAQVGTNISGRCASITLNKHRHKDYGKKRDIRKSAFHEVCEVFMSPLCDNATARFTTAEGIREANHGIIRTLENIIFDGEKANSA